MMNDAAPESLTEAGSSPGRVPPYISFKTLLTFVEDQRQHGVPGQIDRSVLTRFSGAVGTQLLGALKFLGLISPADQSVQPELRELVSAYDTDAWPGQLRNMVERAYQPIVSRNLEHMTPAQFHDVFKAQYPAKDAVLRKCEVFFLNAAKNAGIAINPRVAKHRSPRAAAPRKRQTAGSSGQTEAKPADTDQPSKRREESPGEPRTPRAPSAYEMLINILDPVEMEDDEQTAVWTLIRYLKRAESKK